MPDKSVYVIMQVDTYTNKILRNFENPLNVLIFIITVCHDLKIGFILTCTWFYSLFYSVLFNLWDRLELNSRYKYF